MDQDTTMIQLETSINQLPYDDSMPIDLLLDYPEEQVANVPVIDELVEQEKQPGNDRETKCH